MRTLFIPFSELEALELCQGKVAGCGLTTTSSNNAHTIAANHVLALAERIKNDRINALIDLTINK